MRGAVRWDTPAPGFDVTGVDINPQPNYPYGFHRADAMTYPLEGFEVIHASPPCQRYMTGGLVNRAVHPDLLGSIRQRLAQAGVPYIIENVPGAPLRRDVILCGSMFGLNVRRHRWFELSPRQLLLTPSCNHSRPAAGVYGNLHGSAGAWPGMLPSDLPTWRAAMGIDWMTAPELSEAIPPAYTEFVGLQLIDLLREAA